MSSKLQESSPVLTPTRLLALPRAFPYDIYLLRSVTVTLVLLDIAIAVGAFLLAFFVRQQEPMFYRPVGALLPTQATWNFQPYFTLLFFLPIVRVLTMRHYGMYRLRGEFAYFEDVVNLVKAVTTGSLITIVIVFLYRGGYAYRDFSYSRLIFVYDWCFALAAYGIVRLTVRSIQTVARRRMLNLIPTLIVGTGQGARVCIAEIAEEPRLGYRVIGVLATDGSTPQELAASEIEGVPILGRFTDLPALVKQCGILEVLITDSNLPSSDIFQAIMRSGRKNRVAFRTVPNLFNCLPRKTEIDQVGSLPMVKLFEEPLVGPNRFFKRALDVTVALLGLVALAPIWAVIAWLIKRESPGPALYTQERVGMDGRVFKMYKFRTMRAGADDSIHRELMRSNIQNSAAANVGTSDEPVYGKVPNDPRMTRIGSFLRRYSIDEQPNLLNVLFGEMSLVGPRPPIPYEVEMYEEWHRARFNIKPGITGLWQVSGRSRLNFEQMVQLDLYYIENWSFWLELKILLKTIPVVLRGDNAY